MSFHEPSNDRALSRAVPLGTQGRAWTARLSRWRAPFAILAAGAMTTAAMTATASASASLPTVTITLEWLPQAEFAGYYAAEAEGYYKAQGINVVIKPGGPDVDSLQLLVAGQTDIADSGFASVLAARDAGADIVTIGQTFERPGARLLALASSGVISNSGAITASSLRGRNIDVWDGNQPNVSALFAKLGLKTTDVHVFTQGANMEPLLSGQVAVAEGETYNEYAQALAGSHGKKINVFNFSSMGLAVLEDSINAMPSWLKSHASEAVAFIRASALGWIYCRENPSSCVNIVDHQGVALQENFQVWQMAQINQLIWPSTVGVYNMSAGMFSETANILLKYGVIKHAASFMDDVNLTYRNKAVAKLTKAQVYGTGFVGQDLNPQKLFG
jgi:NitT/TauT family transport system substrate-binding protein